MYEEWLNAKKVVVIGAGTMGSGIAAHLANIGFEVSLLDLTRESCQALFDKARTSKPPHFFVQDRANSVRIGGIDENLDWVRDADWVCEAIIEKLDAKKALFEKLEPLLSPSAMISTNTSGLQISLLAEGRSESFQARFLGTHFFNPPRYLKLLELIPTDKTSPEAIEKFTEFLEEKAARRVVVAKDTPGFIANRYGMWSMYFATHVAEKLRLSPEIVDVITGPFLGRPRSGTFRLNDLVGFDIMQDIARNLTERCPDDARTADFVNPKSLQMLSEKGWIGDKSGQGYYRREGRELLAYDLSTEAYRQRVEPSIPSIEKYGKLPLGERIAATLMEKDEAGEYLREYLIPALQYAVDLKEEISHSVQDFDRVMMWGFGWQMGPFAMIDAIGAENLGMKAEKFYRPGEQRAFNGTYAKLKAEPQYASLTDFPIIGQTETYCLRDLGDGVLAVGAKTKLGSISPAYVDELIAFFESHPEGRFVLTSEAKSFSVGFDLRFFDEKIAAADGKGIDHALSQLQRLGEILEGRRIVAALHGHSLGAGLELAMSCPQIIALADAQIGLPETKVGLIPGGRGTVLVRLNNQGSIKRASEVAINLAQGLVAANADEARQLGYLRSTDIICYHPDRLLMDAKAAALKVEPTMRPGWTIFEGPLSGMIDRELESLVNKGTLTDYDRSIGEKIRFVFAKPSNYAEAMAAERKEFLDLAGKALSHARIKHMLENGKPLRN